MEGKLQEIYKKSEAVAQLLSITDFCTVDNLTSTLNLSVSNVSYIGSYYPNTSVVILLNSAPGEIPTYVIK